ncbi:unnamed protein product [Prunus armeniaca]
MTDFPLRSILHSPDASQRLMKWAIKLSQYDLLYRPKTAIKAQALADFVAEFTPSAEEEKLVSKKKESSRADKTSTEPDQPRDMWQLRVHVAVARRWSVEPERSWNRHRHHHLGWNPARASYHTWLPGFKQRGRVRDIARWLALGKGAINQKVGHLLRFPADHKSSLRRVHGEAPEDDPVP